MPRWPVSRPVVPVVLAATALSLLIAGCGGGEPSAAPAPSPSSTSAPQPPPTVTPTSVPMAFPSPVGPSTIQPVVVSNDLAVGPNRFVAGLVQGGAPVLDARLHFRFFKIDEQSRQATPVSEADARPVTIARSFAHVHQDGQAETHEVGTVGVYVAQATFDAPGNWGVEITGTTRDGQALPPLTPLLAVRERSISVGIGQPAPLTKQPVLADVGGDISSIDTSTPPSPEMHQMTIAGAASSGRPTVIVFASPGYCVSQICGPTKSLVDELYGQYQGRANFIHVEPFDVARARRGESLTPVPAMAEWGLLSEPWVFMLDSKGKVAAKFQGIVSLDELDAALRPLLS